MSQKWRLVFDIDGTICNNTNGSYEDAHPYKDMIALINEMYDAGHYIIFHTARGMGKHNGNRALAYKDWFCLTKMQLEDWGVKFHELHLGKILGDVYVDDRGFRLREDGSSAEDLRSFLKDYESPRRGTGSVGPEDKDA